MEDDQQFCLRWNNHQSTIIQNFDTLLESGTLVDCTLAAEGKYLKAHKVVLSACSPYFEGLLSEHYDKHPVFILKDVKFKELKAMMDYMYRGEVNISQDQLTALLKAAESLQIKGLSDSRTDKGTGNTGNTTTGGSKDNTRPAKTASSTAAASASAAAVDIPHTSSGLTIEKNSKVPRQSIQQVSVSDQLENSASPQLRGHSSREGSQSPTRKRKRLRRRSLGNDDNSMENHEASNSSDVNMTAPALGVAPVAEEKSQADPADSIGRSALMQQLTKPADEMLQMPLEKPEPSEDMIQPKSEYQDDQESVEDLTNFDDDMNDLNEMEQDNSRAGPSHDPSQHAGMPSWHIAGDRSNASVVGAAAGPGAGDEVFLAAAEAAQAQRDSQATIDCEIKPEPNNLDEDRILASMIIKVENEHFVECKNEQTMSVSNAILSYFSIDEYRNSCGPKADVKRQKSERLLFDKEQELQELNSSKSRAAKTKAQEMIKEEAEVTAAFYRSLRTQRFQSTKHRKSEVRRVTYTCDQCGSNFKTKKLVRKHIIYHCNKLYKYSCPHCSDYLKFFAYEIYAHIKRHHVGKDIYCVDLHDDTYKTTNFKNKYKKQDKPFKCKKCPRGFLTDCRLRRHRQYECNIKKMIQCEYCDFETKYRSHMNRHVVRLHKKIMEDTKK
ncbi:longitudinals lacking protein, isoforms A/B/D/L isoform X13 [Nasonia vitripennis]|uniref:Longitudinals lacking protein n=1 Tax=Nasonia vitripennis TaxID=7425 RepID=A0A7M7QIM0_NASVI|nr:longitudinals lacking protein, isoforms A/B/D/L isoform X13 [Nasonia vitripennis]